MRNVIILSVFIPQCHYIECCFAVCYRAEHHYSEFYKARSGYAKRYFTEL